MNEQRTPSEAKPARMGALARLPVFLSLGGKRAVLAGGNPAAAWKAELLSAAGAQVDVYASEMSDELGSSRPIRRVARSVINARRGRPRIDRRRRSPSALSKTTTALPHLRRLHARPACR